MMIVLEYNALVDLFRRIHTGEHPHGDFLTSFAGAVVRADPDNMRILIPVALELIDKYHLQDEYTAKTQGGGPS
jgi:hypothetical protein